MKRSTSEESSPVDSGIQAEVSKSTLPAEQHDTPPKKRTKAVTPSPKKQSVSSPKKQPFDGKEMEWNADGREALTQHLIGEGLKSADKTELANKYGVTKSKIHNELSLGRPENMRDKAAKAVRGD